MKDINIMFSELAQYTRIMEEAAATVDSLKDEIKAYMNEHNTDILTGNEHRATYKAIQSSRIDTAALKNDMPDIAARYTKTTSRKRFLFR